MIRVLQFVAIMLIGIGASAFAQEPPRAVPTSEKQLLLSYSPLVKQVSPAVVNIYTKRVVQRRYSPFMGDPFFERFFGRSFGGLNRSQVESALGSGTIVDPDGVVITNAHVVEDAEEISVVLNDGREFEARISLSDESSDLAVLRVDTKGQKLPFATLKQSENLEVGDIVLAIGNPFGVGQTVTSGIISAPARASLNINDFNFFIQTDAAINPGNSGGPLVAMDGKVIGINTAIYSRDGGSLGIGFAVPTEIVQTVIAAEKSGAKNANVTRPWLGATGQGVTSDIAESLGLETPRGVLISSLYPSSPAKKAGVKVGDIVTALNGRDVSDPAELKFRLATVPIGEMANLSILRKGKINVIEMEAMTPPNDPPANITELSGRHLLSGAKIANINPLNSVELGLENDDQGVVILELPGRSRAGGVMRKGDIVVSVNDRDIKKVEDLISEIQKAAESGYYDLVVSRNGRQNRIVIR